MKIKRYLIILMISLSVIIAYFCNQNYNQDLYYRYFSYLDRIGQIEEKHVIPIAVSILDHNEITVKNFLEKIIEFCNDYDYTFNISYTTPKENSAGTIEHFALYTKNPNILKDLASRNAKGLKFNDLNETGYYSTNLNDKDCVGWIELIDNSIWDRYNEIVWFETLNNSIEYISTLDSIAFCFYDEDVSRFEANFNKFLKNENLNNKINFQNYYEGYHGAQLQTITNEKVNKLLTLVVYVVVIYILFFIIDMIKQKKTILIQRIHGIGIVQIVCDKLLKMFAIHYFIFNLIMYITLYILTNKKLFYEPELLKQTVIISIGLLGFFIGAFVICCFAVNFIIQIKTIKSQGNSHKNLFAVLIIKILLLIIFTAPVLNILSEAITNGKNYYFINNNKDIFNNLYRIDGGINKLDDQEKVFNHYLKNGGIYCDFQQYYFRTYDFLKENYPQMNEEELEQTAIKYPIIYVNANYLKSLDKKVYTIGGTEVDIDNLDDDVLLVPQACDLNDFSNMMFNGEKKKILIKNPGMFVNYSVEELLLLENPIIYLTTKKNFTCYFDHLFIPLENNNVNKISDQILKISDNKARIQSYDNTIELSIFNIQSFFKEAFVLSVLYLIIYISIIYQSVFWFIEEFKKTLLLEYLFGKSKIERYFYLFFLNIIFYLIPIVCCGIIQKVVVLDMIKLYVCTIVFEIVIMCLMIRNIEKNNANVILKGESNL